jgi:pimeloyl-ACP methyl ester carboxylesterase
MSRVVSAGDAREDAHRTWNGDSVKNMRSRTPAFIASLGLLAAGMTGLVSAPAASAFTPTLTYVPCPAEAEPSGVVRCAELTVPLDWQTPDDGRTTTIALRVIPSKRSGGGFTFNPGGPGGEGIDIGADVYLELPQRIRERFDLVMWDPRGVGLSGPAVTGCEPMPGPDLPPIGPVDWQTAWSDLATRTGEAIADCFARNPDSAPYLGTWQVVRDLEAMREALGYPRWNYWGMSYGTRIGYTYAKTFPGSIRTMIVDGSLWPQESVYRLASQQPAAWVTALQVYSSVMGRAQARKFEQVLEVLDDTVLQTPDQTITRWDVGSTIYGQLGAQRLYPQIRATINILYDAIVVQPTTRSRAAAVTQVQALQDSAPDPAEQYIFSFINCADLHDRPTAQTAGRMAESAAQDYGNTVALATRNITKCQGLPADYSPGVPREWTTISLSTPPVVVLSLGDTNTPWLWGRTMANQYAGSRTINYNSSQHVTYMQTPSSCVNDPVTRYALNRTLPSDNIFCGFVPSPQPEE